MCRLRVKDGLLFVGERLIIPRAHGLPEMFFRLAHDALGHFGADKSYDTLRQSYYWPNMRKDLMEGYIPSCAECQCNKSNMKKRAGPLHPLPVPDTLGDAITIDFIGPLPEDEGFNMISTITDQSGADVHLIPCRSEMSGEEFTAVFFKHWYCENGLPKEIVSDRDKLFISKFWSHLHKLTGVKLKMSTSYHPQSDGTSEHTNKTINQCLCFHVERNQKGWVRALPQICFNIMNTANASTGFSPFQLHLGHLPHMLPPLVQDASQATPEETCARDVINRMEHNFAEAQDNLLLAKASQAAQVNKSRGPDPSLSIEDLVMLSTKHVTGYGKYF